MATPADTTPVQTEMRSRIETLLDGLTMADLTADGVITLDEAERDLKAKGYDPYEFDYLYE